MGRRGPQPAANTLKVLRGDRPEDINFNEATVRPGMPTPPLGMAPEVRAVFAEVVEAIDRVGILTDVDHFGIEAMANAIWTHRQATDAIARDGVTWTDEAGKVVVHPAVAIARHAAANIRQWSTEFGLTPTSRSQINVSAAAHARGSGDVLTELAG